MYRGQLTRIQDAVHGLMEFAGNEIVVLDLLRTPELQRLRRIRQLGLAHLVFPGAEHSRFAHSLGAAHLALRFATQLARLAPSHYISALCPDADAISDFVIASLCHDLGHGPLSHAWEQGVIDAHFDRSEWAKCLGLDPTDPLLSRLPWHEFMTHALLNWPDGQLHRLLETHAQGTAERIRGLLGGRYHHAYLPRLLTSDIDVDRADYLLRDAHHTGVDHGSYDLDWLVASLRFGATPDTEEEVVGFSERKGLTVVRQFMAARQAMYDTVYYHKTVRCAERMAAMLLGYLSKRPDFSALRSGNSLLHPLLDVLEGKPVTPEAFLEMDDFALFVLLKILAESRCTDPVSKDLANRLLARDLFKSVLVSSARLEKFLLLRDAWPRLHEAVRCFFPSEPECYVFCDVTGSSGLSVEPSTCAYLIDDHHRAIAAGDHDSLKQHGHQRRTSLHLYTPAEAREAVTKMVEAST